MPGLGTWLLVMAGGALGAVLRVFVTRWSLQRLGANFPWGTMMVNLSGAFLIGVVFGGLFAGFGWQPSDPTFIFLAYGVLGSYTTVSALSLEWLLLVRKGESTKAWIYLIGSLAGGVVLVLVGMVTSLLAGAQWLAILQS